jgi:serine/threonine-protein phosphatase 5
MADLVDSSSDVERATQLKDEGNAFLANHRYAQAAEKYTQAIAIHPSAIYYSNRAQALIKLESYGQAIEDANEALKLDPKYVKAYYRRGSANYALGRLKLALKDFKAVLSIFPKEKDALAKAKECEKIIKQVAFLKAIESEAAPEEVLDFDAIVVESSYSGPRLEKDQPITMEFVAVLMEYFREQQSLHRRYVVQILQMATTHIKSLPSLLRLYLPGVDPTSTEEEAKIEGEGTFIVCGDIHGQYYDLLRIFELGGLPGPTSRFLFNGDFVDRGSFSFETIMLLLTIMLARPKDLFLHRGNHETKNMNMIYGFEGEVKHKYDNKVFSLFSKLFQSLPLASVIQDKVFVTHGGLSTIKEGRVSLDEIAAIDRFREPPESGLMADLLWSDPQPQHGRATSKRGMGFAFGPDYTERFLAHNKLQLVIRSHEVRDEGYEIEHDSQCITVFSAPNYCDQMGNKAAFIRFSDSRSMAPQFTQFTAAPHPNIPPMRYASNLFSL